MPAQAVASGLESIREAHQDEATTGHIKAVYDAKLVHLPHGLQGLGFGL